MFYMYSEVSPDSKLMLLTMIETCFVQVLLFIVVSRHFFLNNRKLSGDSITNVEVMIARSKYIF